MKCIIAGSVMLVGRQLRNIRRHLTKQTEER